MKISAKYLKLAAVAVVAIVALYFVGSYLTGSFGIAQPSAGKYDELAKCLTQKGAVMYGASWCSHCAEQKALFGDSFQYVTYVECAIDGSNEQAQACKDAGVTAYPAWKINGQLSYGTKPLADLAKLAGCEI